MLTWFERLARGWRTTSKGDDGAGIRGRMVTTRSKNSAAGQNEKALLMLPRKIAALDAILRAVPP